MGTNSETSLPLACFPSLLPNCTATFLVVALLHLCASTLLLSICHRRRFELELRAWRADILQISQLEKDPAAREKEILTLEKNVLERECELLRRERDSTAKENDARVLGLETELGETRTAVMDMRKLKEIVESRMLEREADFLEMEAKWEKERGEIQNQKAAELDTLQRQLAWMKLELEDQELQIRHLTEAKKEVEAIGEALTEKNLELIDKLSEYRLQLQLAQSTDAPLLPPDFIDVVSFELSRCDASERDKRQTQSTNSSPCNYPPGLLRSPDRYNRTYAMLRGATCEPLSESSRECEESNLVLLAESGSLFAPAPALDVNE